MKIQGAFPVRWAPEPGRDGTGVFIRTATTKYAASTSGTVTPTSGWQNSVPEVSNGNYLWTWVHVEYSDGTQTDLYSVSRMGIDGRGIQSSVVTYSQQATPVDPETITNWGSFPSTLTDGYWLYTKTHVVYSDNQSTDSYSVSQIGVGSYYAGCEEYYAAGSSESVCPTGAAQPGTLPPGQSVQTSWTQSRPPLTLQNPYLWNFEVSHDSRGNSYITAAVCIGNFAKGITSIVETYTISSHDNVTDMLADTAERTANPWTDEQHAAAPTEAKRYQWNKTVTEYNKGASDTFYHISAVKGIDGSGAVYIDLDNENDSMLYDGAGNLVGGQNGWVKSNIHLYANGQEVTNGLPTFSIQSRSASISSANAVISGTELTIKGLSGDSGWVIVGCTYNGVPYTATMSVKKLVGQDKYEIDIDKKALSYNQTRNTLSDATATIKIYRTAQNGTRTLVNTLSTYGLTIISSQDRASSYDEAVYYSGGEGTAHFTAADAAQITHYSILLKKDGNVIDRETIPINKVQDGPQGAGAIILDMDNENDTILYDGNGNKVSADVTSQGILLDGGEDKTANVTSWSLANKTNLTASINSSGLVTITAISATTGSVEVRAVYGGVTYKSKITIKKLVGVDKYDIVCTPSALTYNTTKQQNQNQNIKVEVFRTAQNGARTLVSSLGTYGLTLLFYYKDSGGEHSPSTIVDGTGSGQYHNGVNIEASVVSNLYYRFDVVKDSVVQDSETVQISKNSDGEGKDAFILDLDNENDSMLYDGADSLVSGQVISTASLFKGPDKVSSGITWSIDSVVGCTKANGGTATNTEQTGATDAWISTNGLVKVNGISADNAKVVVKATYNSKTYTATLTIKKLKGVDKYDLVIKPSALTYNQTTQKVNGATSVTVAVEVWRTAQNGTRTRISDYNQSGGGAHHLDISVKYGNNAVSTTAKSYGVDFSVGGSLAENASSFDVVLKKDNIVQDSETIPIAKTANGSGLPGPGAKAIYKLSFEKPATPTGASPSGWSNDIPTQDDVKVTPQGEWVKDDDGYLRAPSLGTYQTNIETLSFVTTASNQKIYLRVKATVGAGSFVEIGKVDRGSISTSDDYIRHVSGSNQDTGDIEVTVPDAGTHFIIVKYYRAGNADSYAKVIFGMMSLWQSNAKTYNGDNVATWSEPFRANTASSDDEPTQTRSNLLKQTPFISGLMNEWDVHNGSTTTGIQGRNAFKGDPAYDEAKKNLLQQKVYNPDGDKPLQPNSWYTLSFWAKADAYKQYNINQTTNAYVFGLQKIYFEAGVQNTLTVSGSISQAAKNAGKVLRVYVFGPESSWSWNRAITIESTDVTSQTLTFEVPETGWYYINSYVYLLPNGGNSPVSGHTAYVEYYRVTRGMRLMTRLYPSTGGDAYSAIDTTAGRKIDGEHEYSAPADNAAEFKLSEAWSRHTITFKTKATFQNAVQELLFELHEASHTTYICMPKLEQGTSATDYVTNESDMAEMAAEETGFPNDRGQYVDDPSQTSEGLYQWNDTRRDYVAYSISGVWKRYFVRRKGQTVPVNTPPTAGGNTYWEEGSVIRTLLVNTIVGANAELTFAKTNRILVVNDEDVVCAGIGGANNDSDYPLWIGATYANRANAPFKVNLAGKLFSTNADITGKVTASSGTIGGFVISEIALTNDEAVRGAKIQIQNQYIRASIGGCDIPDDHDDVLYGARISSDFFSNEYDSLNVAIRARARGSGAAKNFALHGEGKIVTQGLVDGWRMVVFSPESGNNTIQLEQSNRIFLNNTHNYNTCFLPTLSMVRSALMIADDKPFAVKITLFAMSSINVYGYTNTAQDCPKLINSDGGVYSMQSLGNGDVFNLMLVWDGSDYKAWRVSLSN